MATNGSMQADAFLFQELVGPGDVVVVEAPTYDRTLLSLRQLGAELLAIPLEADGTLPRQVIIVVPAGPTVVSEKPHDCRCASATSPPPRDPSSSALVEAAETFSADKGGRCVDFLVPNRTIEEYLFIYP